MNECCKRYNNELLSRIVKLENENIELKKELEILKGDNNEIIKINKKYEKDINYLIDTNEVYNEMIQKQYLSINGIKNEDIFKNIIENKDKIEKYDNINNKLLEKNINMDETINIIDNYINNNKNISKTQNGKNDDKTLKTYFGENENASKKKI
jgi:hypothetical protein